MEHASSLSFYVVQSFNLFQSFNLLQSFHEENIFCIVHQANWKDTPY